ncbi:MAG: peptidylprolyl isomerase [Oligoflexia bacterium]|nr:MAG: peptidylprolyl isomerase [Oligoflexia bacterium]
MKSFSVFIGVVLAGTLAFAQAAKDETIAIVGSKKITLEEFNKKYLEVKNQAVNPPTKAQFLEDLVRYELGVQEAEKKALEKDPMVQDRMKQELYRALLEKELGQKVQKISVSDKEMEDYYKKNPEIRTSHILIELKPGATAVQRAEAQKRAKEIFEEVKKSKRSFEELVKLYSDDPLSKQAGGDVGWQNRTTLVPAYYDAVVNAKTGEIKGLVETPYGIHIVKVTGVRAFENANKRQLRAAVFDEKRKQVFNEYFDKLKRGYTIKTNPKLIE